MWTTALSQLSYPVCDKIAAWLTKPLRLAQAMRSISPDVTVNLLGQRLVQSTLEDEAPVGDRIWLREVLLYGHHTPWCFARIIVPQSTYQFFLNTFESLGEHLLGDTFLYQEDNAQRSAFEFAALPSTDTRLAAMPASIKQSQSVFFARRSQFVLQNQSPLIVMEAFLNTIPALQQVSV